MMGRSINDYFCFVILVENNYKLYCNKQCLLHVFMHIIFSSLLISGSCIEVKNETSASTRQCQYCTMQ